MAMKIAPLAAGAALVGFLGVGTVTLASAQEASTTTTTTPSSTTEEDPAATADEDRNCDHDDPSGWEDHSPAADSNSL